MENKPWYSEGLHFKCSGCGGCCTGSPGYTWVTIEEMEQIAEQLQIDFDTFTKKYVRKVGERYSLLEKGEEFDCVFLTDNRCEIYHARPKQCRTYPFWPEILESKERWESEARHCEGISPDGELITIGEIEKCKNS